MKMKEFRPRGGRVPGTPLDPPMLGHRWIRRVAKLLKTSNYTVVPRRTNNTMNPMHSTNYLC